MKLMQKLHKIYMILVLTGSKIDIAKNQLEVSKVSSENIKNAKILEALSAYLNYLKTYNILKYAKESEK